MTTPTTPQQPTQAAIEVAAVREFVKRVDKRVGMYAEIGTGYAYHKGLLAELAALEQRLLAEGEETDGR